jgi:hypothetical protein
MRLSALFIIAIVFFVFLNAEITFAHPGNTDKYGCHTCKTNCPSWGLKKGEYHCHKQKALPWPKPSIKSKKVK